MNARNFSHHPTRLATLTSPGAELDQTVEQCTVLVDPVARHRWPVRLEQCDKVSKSLAKLPDGKVVRYDHQNPTAGSVVHLALTVRHGSGMLIGAHV